MHKNIHKYVCVGVYVHKHTEREKIYESICCTLVAGGVLVVIDLVPILAR